MIRPALTLAAAAVALSPVPSSAQDAERYQLERTQDGYVRLDTRSGRMSLCQERGERLICRAASEERGAYENRVEALEDRIEALEDRIAALEGRQAGNDLPSEKEFEQTLGYMERFFRRFMDIVTEMDRRSDPDQPPPPEDRT